MTQPRTSLEVGFAEGAFPENYTGLRGRDFRAVPLCDEFPYEDAQFEVVLLAATAVTYKRVKEAHRVLRPSGRLYFTVPERTSKQLGYVLPDIYAIVREGFDIIDVERPAWWLFGRRGRTISICARKKNWKAYKGLSHDGTCPLSPFWSSS